MKSRRYVLIALVLAIAYLGIGPSYGSQYFANHIQRVPQVLWTVPGPEPLDGIGQWVYVAPIPPPGPQQQPSTGYVYGLNFSTSGGGGGVVGLSRDEQGPIAGIVVGGQTPGPVTIRYDWSPGKFYFLLAHHLEGSSWGGWVFDDAATAWTFIGTAVAPAASASQRALNTVGGAQSETRPAFSQIALGAISGTCRGFPQVDVYYSAPVGYRDSDMTPASFTEGAYGLGDCPGLFTREGEWLHIRIGSPPVA